MNNITIVIPARYGSTRFPGKPLELIAGKSMLSRVIDVAKQAAKGKENVEVLVATDDERILHHAEMLRCKAVMTPESCESGSDRALAAVRAFYDEGEEPDFVLNLQGDAPFTPVSVIEALLNAFEEQPYAEVITPVHRLSWSDLDRLREAKKTTPYSGTTATVNTEGYAMWFSKNIIPAMRKEPKLREQSDISPIYQHMGLYGFRYNILKLYCSAMPGIYEQLEGLEQLRMIENGIKISAVEVEIPEGTIQSGIDTPEDVQRAEALLNAKGLA